jgi:hypothetical protein
MRTFALAVGLLGVFASQVALAQEPPPAPTQPPPTEPAPPPAVAAPGTTGTQMQVGPAAGPTGPSLWGVLPWGGYGLGARYMIPVPITQILTRTRFRDYWALEFGADMLHFNYDYGLGGTAFSYSWTEIIPVVGMMWQVWLTDDFAVYPKIELGYAFGWYSDTNGTSTGTLSGGNHFFPDGTAGLLYKLGNGITLRAEAGYVGGKAGVAWLF